MKGQGLGSALIRPALDRCDSDGLPAYLEATASSSPPYDAGSVDVTWVHLLPFQCRISGSVLSFALPTAQASAPRQRMRNAHHASQR